MLGKAGMVLPLIFEHKPWGNHPWSSDTESKGGLGEQAFPYTIDPLYNHTFGNHFFFVMLMNCDSNMYSIETLTRLWLYSKTLAKYPFMLK
jgi:hypothetical protein